MSQVELNEMGVVENMMQAEFTSEDLQNTRSLRLIRNDPKTLAVRQAQGYKIVLDPEGKHIKTFLPRQPDGSYRFGDVVLAQCPKRCERNEWQEQGEKQNYSTYQSRTHFTMKWIELTCQVLKLQVMKKKKGGKIWLHKTL